jgi:tRNA(adenine34) deaminase
LGHAEIQAIKKACKKTKSWRLESLTLYVTLEPCSMCMGLIVLSRIKRVVFGAASPLFGYHLDNGLALSLYKRKIAISGGVCGEEAAALLQKFFKNKGKR